MKWSMFVGALVLSVSLCTSQHSYGFELLDRMLGVGCGCDTCGCDAAPSCGCDTGCDAAPAGCDAKPTCGCEKSCGCEKKSCCKSRCCGGLLDFLHCGCDRGCCKKVEKDCGCDSGVCFALRRLKARQTATAFAPSAGSWEEFWALDPVAIAMCLAPKKKKAKS